MAKKKKKEAREESEDLDETGGENEDEELAPLIRAPEFFKTYATRTIPYLTEYDVRVVLANETMGDEEGW